MVKKNLKVRLHPINAYPFEALYNGSWRNVDHIRIKKGKIITHFDYLGFKTEEKVPITSLRLKSRIANTYDCTCFLRPGVDVCVLPSYPTVTNSDPQLAWIDAKINSIERKPHELSCTCRFNVSLNAIHHPLGTKKNISNGEIKGLGIENIAILQQLERKPCEDGYFRWISSVDSLSKSEAKLFRGQFMCDISWLLVASTLKGVEFQISSEQNKMVYRVLDGITDMFYFQYDKTFKVINFKVEDEVMKPKIRTFVPEVKVEASFSDNIGMAPLIDIKEDDLGQSSQHDLKYLRRSKRQKVQPDRYVSEDFLKAKSGAARTKTEKTTKLENAEDLYIILSSDSDSDCSVRKHYSKHTSKKDSDRKLEDCSEKTTVKEVKAAINNGATCKSAKTSSTCERLIVDKVLCELLEESNYVSKQNNNKFEFSVRNSPTLKPSTVPIDSLPDPNDDSDKNQNDCVASHNEKASHISFKHVKSGSQQRKNLLRANKRVVKGLQKMCLGQEHKSKCSFPSRIKRYYSVGTYQRTLNRREYEEIIKRCIQHIDSEIGKHQQPDLYQWEEIISHQWWKLPQTPPSSYPVEDPELDDLWKEMEMSIHSRNFLEKNKSDHEGFANKSNVDDGQPCQHDFVLNEEIGTICRFCRSVGTEVRNILPPFLERSGRRRCMQYDQTRFDGRHADDMELDYLEKPASSRNASIHRESGNVWALIPDLRDKLHTHQKIAFEFLWMNIARSLNPADMDFSLARSGGCVISHSPGAGKTLLVISFLISYLKLFPGGRPLILAPKTTMHTWYKEIHKWEVSVPVYQIHSRRSYRKELQKTKRGASPGDFKLNMNVKHAVDCLEKFEKWHKHTSILLMTYPSFQAIMRGNSVDKHLNYMARVLRKSPGLLILDEGHNPRSTSSVLRKTLMQVKTEKRILLSGTLFQNNFGEYFNTLCLARPSFITKVLSVLAPDSRRNQYIKERLRTNKEAIARKFFVEKIGNMIKSKVAEERKKGLDILHKISNNFIDVYEGAVSDSLPGLKSFKLLIKPTPMQQTFLEKIQKEDSCKRFRLELELLISFISIHPWLVRTIPYAERYYRPDDVEEIKKCDLDVSKGPKVRFVVDLVQRCIIKREKVLIFCRNLAPIRLLVKVFEDMFQWKKGNQILVLHGEQEFLERSKVIDKFEEPGGSSQVLVASISACSEGISLTAASRVVLLDSEWNPSRTKQAVARAFRPGQKKVVYVYQLLASGTLEEDKHGRNTWKERISRMIFVGAATEGSSCRQTENIDDDVLMDIMEADHGQLIHRITKDEELSGRLGRSRISDVSPQVVSP